MMEFRKSKVFDLVRSVDYSSGSVVSRMVLKEEMGNITLFAFDKDQGISEHSAPFDVFLQVTEGTGRIIINKTAYDLVAGEFIIMPANIPHALVASERCKIMLVMIKSS